MRPQASENASADHGRLRVRGLVRIFEEGGTRRTVLDGVDLDAAPGELLVIVGKSGSGKSTLLNLVAGIDRADAGQIWVGARELSAMRDDARTRFRRDEIGFVFQFFNLIPTLTVLENVLLHVELAGRVGERARGRARELLSAVGLLDRAASYPERLSGGEQQRVAIAAALVHEPHLVLADEPTGNLDADTGGAVLELLLRLVRGEGRTLIVVTHSADLTAKADRVLTMTRGRLDPA